MRRLVAGNGDFEGAKNIKMPQSPFTSRTRGRLRNLAALAPFANQD